MLFRCLAAFQLFDTARRSWVVTVLQQKSELKNPIIIRNTSCYQKTCLPSHLNEIPNDLCFPYRESLVSCSKRKILLKTMT